MNAKKWIWLSILVIFITALILTVVGINRWFYSGNVRVMGDQVRVSLSGKAYMFEHETRELLGTTLISIDGVSDKGEGNFFDGQFNVMDYINEYDGTLFTNMAVLEGDDGFWEIHVLESCTHLEETEEGYQKEVTHSCKYSYEFYVHPDKQDFLVVRVKDSYAVYPVYVVMADSEEEAWQIYNEYFPGKY